MRNNYTIYRANSKGTGNAINFSIADNKDKPSTFHVKFAPQNSELDKNGNATFNWEKPCNVKLDAHELADFIAVIEGFKQFIGPETTAAGLYHDTPSAVKIIKFGHNEDKKYGEFYLSVNHFTKDEKGNKITPEFYRAKVSLGYSEAFVLREMFKFGIPLLLDWTTEPYVNSTTKTMTVKNGDLEVTKSTTKTDYDKKKSPAKKTTDDNLPPKDNNLPPDDNNLPGKEDNPF